MRIVHGLCSVSIVCSIGVSVALPTKADEKYPLLTDELASGRTVWLNHCEACHAYGIAGAPNPQKSGQWDQRVLKPKSTLYQHAIEGFYGESDTYMPPRGGNPELSEEEVMVAVDYMVALANFHLENNQE